MTFTGVVIGVAVVSIVLTALLYFLTKRINNFILSFLQNFCGILFIFSGYVKAIDPLGTAYKMEQYFAEFKGTFEETWFGFLSDIFPVLSEYAIAFSVTMIVLEIVVGLMLLIGSRVRLASWIFLLIILFFTMLTGFTFLTGYVPSGVNFFEFGQWGPYQKTNMKVTDCGCFGDFLKIEPKMSFFKDVALMLPALIFVFKTDDMHKLFSAQTRNILVGISVIALIWYCLSNFSWDLPHTDFRPFREGVDIREQRQAEIDAANNVEVVAFVLRNKETGKMVELSRDVYFAELTTTYSKDKWEVAKQIKTEPAVAATKLSEFIINDRDGYDISDDILAEEGYNFWIVNYKLPYDVEYEKNTVLDTVYTPDTVLNESTGETQIIQKPIGTKERSEDIAHYTFDQKIMTAYTLDFLPLVDELGYPTVIMVGGVGVEAIDALKGQLETDIPMYEADDILLKTIIRSNPGLVLLKDGVVIEKWHRDKLPEASEIKQLTNSGSNN